MKTLTITISEKQYSRYGFSREQFDFDEFVKMLKKEMAKDALRKTRAIAGRSALANLTMEEINAEVKAVRGARKQRRHAQTGS